MQYNHPDMDNFTTVMRPFFLKMYLDGILPIMREKHELMIEHRILNKKRLISEFKLLDRKRYAKQLLQKKMNTHCVDNIMCYI